VWAGNASIAAVFVGYLGVFFPGLASKTLYAGIAAVAAIWVLTAANIAGIRAAGWVRPSLCSCSAIRRNSVATASVVAVLARGRLRPGGRLGACSLLLFAGIPVYVWFKWRESRVPAPFSVGRHVPAE
jgi:amino acid transporter